jgi:hypothetical protein
MQGPGRNPGRNSNPMFKTAIMAEQYVVSPLSPHPGPLPKGEGENM